MPARDPEPTRQPASARAPSPSRPTAPPRQPEPTRHATLAVEANERRLLTPAERVARNAVRQVEAEKAMADHQTAQKAFHKNLARLKAERLAITRQIRKDAGFLKACGPLQQRA